MAPESPEARRARITLTDVARHAGVGVMTASRALSHPEAVSDALRARVMAAVDALGYRRNPAAAALSSGRSRAIPVVIPTLAHPVYLDFLRGVNDVLSASGLPHEVIVATSEYDAEAEQARVGSLLDWHPAGIMVAGVEHATTTRKWLEKARAAGVVVIEFMDLASDPIDINIGFDHAAVGRFVARWLHDRGHRRVATINGMATRDVRAAKRSEAFQATTQALGAEAHVVSLDAPSSMALGAEGFARLLEKGIKVDAIFCANDDIAAGVLFGARQRGIDVPGDLAVIGFNDTEIASMLEPAVTSVRTDRLAMGRKSAELLLQRAGKEAHDPLVIDTGFALIERASTLPRL